MAKKRKQPKYWRVMCKYPNWRWLEYLAWSAPTEAEALAWVETRLRYGDQSVLEDTKSRYRVVYKESMYAKD